jgi:hypothetical protein
MSIAPFLWRTIRTQRYRRRETAQHQQDTEMTRRTVPAVGMGRRSKTQVTRRPNLGRQWTASGRSPLRAELPARA